MIGTSSFQYASASPEREACVTTLLQEQGNYATGEAALGTFSDAVICLAQSGSDTTVTQGCISDLAQIRVVPNAGFVGWFDTLYNAVVCLAQVESDTTVREVCVSDLIRLNANPESMIGELVDATSDAVICLART